MDTICYCTYCKHHPLHDQRKELPVVTGWQAGKVIMRHSDLGRPVTCLLPVSSAFDDLNLEPSDFEYDITAYDDGYAATGVDENSYRIYAACGNEKHEE